MNLPKSAVHVWQISLRHPRESIFVLRHLLSAGEINRAERFAFETLRDRFVVARAAMRQILAEYVGSPSPRDLEFAYNPSGKPELSGSFENSDIRFNLSHSRDHALLAVARGLRLGIDIEYVEAGFATDQVAERFFSSKERTMLRTLPPSHRLSAFFCCWTRKEAYIKALGQGLSLPLDSFDVDFETSAPAAIVSSDGSGSISPWTIYGLESPADYRAALVAEGSQHSLVYITYLPR